MALVNGPRLLLTGGPDLADLTEDVGCHGGQQPLLLP